MAAEDRIVGSGIKLTFTPDGGSALSLEADFTEFSIDRSYDTVDVTAGNETARYHKATIENMEWSATLYDSNPAHKDDLLPGTVGVLLVEPEGAGVGKEEYSFETLITSYNETYPFDGVCEIELSGVRLGAMTIEQGTAQTV